MKFMKSNLAKKLIIILIVLMIFNVAIPKQVNAAWNFSGILMKPITSLLLGYILMFDVSLGFFMNVLDITAEGVGGFIEKITEEAEKDAKLVQDGKKDEATFVEKIQIGGSIAIEKIFIGPDTIFSGGVALLDANIFEATASEELFEDKNAAADSVENVVTDITSGSNFAGTIKRGIATTYVVLRNICAMIMLAGLIFTGIRVLMSLNNPQQKASWLQLVYDWLVGMILLIFSHVLMYGIFWISDALTEALKDSLMGFGGLNFSLAWTCLTSFDSATQIVCLVLLVYMIYLTVIFGAAYFKRLLWVCVLIVIAPITSIMYAFGNKTKQIYSSWLKEYVTTVLVQPFHLIVYYTLVSVPLNMVSGETLEYKGLGIFTMIYALGAISFIRPAEKYIRELFGMHQGIVAHASFDSGKKTVTDTVKLVGTVATTAATAGLGGAAMGALKSGQFFKTAINATRQLLPSGGKASELLNLADSNVDKSMAKFGEARDKVSDWVFKNKKGKNFIDNASSDTPTGISKGDDTEDNENNRNELIGLAEEKTDFNKADNINEDSYGIISRDSSSKQQSAEEDDDTDKQISEVKLKPLNGDLEEQKEHSGMDSNLRDNQHQLNAGDGTDEKIQTKSENSEVNHNSEKMTKETENGDMISEEPQIKTAEDPEHKETIEKDDLQETSDKEIDTTDKAREDLENQRDSEDKKDLNAANININTASVTIKQKPDENKENAKDKDDSSENEEDKKDQKDSTEEANEKLEQEKENIKGEDKQKLENEQNIGIDAINIPKETSDNTQETTNDNDVEKDDFLTRRKKDFNAGTDLARGESTISESLRKLSPDSKLGKVANDFLDTDLGKAFEEFERLGGLQQLHEGFNTLRDDFFVGQAPGDWKTTNSLMSDSIKARQAQNIFNLVNNENYQNEIIIQEKYKEKLREQYPDKNKYPDVRITEMAREKAREKIKGLADTYVPLGVKNPMIMLELDKDRKQYGMTAKEAVQQRINYEKFNIEVKNVEHISQRYEQTNVSSVQQAVQPAREYYNNGYKDVGDLVRVHDLTTLLKVTPEYGMKLDKILKKKGTNINLNLDKRKDLDDKSRANIQTFLEKNYINKGIK